MGFEIKDGQKILFIGDSITDCGRRDQFRSLGNGYVKFFYDMMITNFPERKIEIVNKGISGNTILDLVNRWEDDVIYQKSDFLSILIGINDIHRVLRKDEMWPEFTPENYRKRYDYILKRTTEKLNCKIILIEPFYISKDMTDSFRGKVLKEIEEYIEIVAQMSKKYETYHIKMHRIFQKYLEYFEPEVFAPEPVHPNSTGHFLIANEIFKLFKK
ncbi:MAG: SGNH/GDSL hydrolase family protein [Candidatus Omnitrophica bacterium]|nr:SGNH/GDSL hydrolase family protein [Candidatus Omnitrophota bacterium]MCM8802159.1 SGNH/GDSL hydrolase family protein [Candidatus Omnitrophota bacterium]